MYTITVVEFELPVAIATYYTYIHNLVNSGVVVKAVRTVSAPDVTVANYIINIPQAIKLHLNMYIMPFGIYFDFVRYLSAVEEVWKYVFTIDRFI